MKSFLMFSFLLSTGIYNNILAQDSYSKPIDIVKQSLYNPSDFWILDDSTLIISDNTTNYPIYLVNSNSDMILKKIRKGKGPGELSTMYKNISVTDEYIYVWDYGSQLLNYYDYQLDFIGSKSFENMGYIYSILLDNKYVYFVKSKNDFIDIYSFDKRKVIGDKLESYSISDNPYFKQFENIVMRQAFKTTVHNHNLIIANEFTSLIFSVNTQGITFSTIEPLSIVQEATEGIYTSTDLLYNELCSLDIDVDSEGKIFVLSKGEKASMSEISNTYDNNINNYLEDFINTRQLLLYNLKGKFVEKINLQGTAKKINFYKNRIFYLRTSKGSPVIGFYD